MEGSPLSRSALVLAGVVLTGCGSGNTPSTVAFDLPQTATKEMLVVGCNSFPPNGAIPEDFSAYGASMIPEVTWANVPAGAKSLLFMIEDPDAPGAKPFVHWVVTNIDPKAAQIPGAGTAERNSNGEAKYYGPHPPAGPEHHYHFEMFALDETVGPDVQDRDSAVAAMAGHVVAKGEFVATYAKP